jgi:transcriptional regulator
MYIPAAFHETDQNKIFDLIERYSFGLLVSQHEGAPYATHLPLLLDRKAGPHGTLVGHVARGNLQWQHAQGQTVMAVFSGPHAYISPTWYETQNVVPTWNYVAVHAYGVFQAVPDAEPLMKIVDDTANYYEASLPAPWKLDVGSDYSKKMVNGIVGFRIEITKLEGKWKLNQNHPQERIDKVVRVLEGGTDANGREVAELMRALPEKK